MMFSLYYFLKSSFLLCIMTLIILSVHCRVYNVLLWFILVLTWWCTKSFMLFFWIWNKLIVFTNTIIWSRSTNYFHHHPANAKWTLWEPWTPCSVSCGDGGKRSRYRHCHPPKNGGDECGAPVDEGYDAIYKDVVTEDCKHEMACPGKLWLSITTFFIDYYKPGQN